MQNNLIKLVETGNDTESVREKIKEMEIQIKEINDKIYKFETTKKTFTPDDIRMIKNEFTRYVREECNEDTLAVLNEVIDKVEIDDVIEVVFKKNIRVSRDTKNNF